MLTEEEKVMKPESKDERKSSKKEKVSAGDDVIAYAENEALQGETVAEEAKPTKAASTVTETVVRVQGTDGLTGRKIWAPLDDITNINRTIYVESIHTTQPIILAVQYRAMGHFREVVMRIDEATFNELSAHPKFSKPRDIRHSYVSDFLQNDPSTGHLLQRTYQCSYPEWIKMEDVLKQDKEHVKYHGVKLTTDLERKLFPVFKIEKVEETPEEKAVRKARKEAAEATEVEIVDEFSNERPSLQEAMSDG